MYSIKYFVLHRVCSRILSFTLLEGSEVVQISSVPPSALDGVGAHFDAWADAVGA
jgi:hypothetical protein